MESDAPVVLGKTLAVARETGRRTVLKHPQVAVFDRIKRLAWTVDVGLANIEVVNLGSALGCSLGKGGELANRRLGHVQPTG